MASHIFTHCIMGILKHKTRILCTHHWKYLHAADVIVVMEHGRVTCTGAPHEVLKEDTLIKKISIGGRWSKLGYTCQKSVMPCSGPSPPPPPPPLQFLPLYIYQLHQPLLFEMKYFSHLQKLGCEFPVSVLSRLFG